MSSASAFLWWRGPRWRGPTLLYAASTSFRRAYQPFLQKSVAPSAALRLEWVGNSRIFLSNIHRTLRRVKISNRIIPRKRAYLYVSRPRIRRRSRATWRNPRMTKKPCGPPAVVWSRSSQASTRIDCFLCHMMPRSTLISGFPSKLFCLRVSVKVQGTS